MKKDVLSTLLSGGVVAVIRAENPEVGEKIATACVAGGIKAIEITCTVPNANTVIEILTKKFKLSDLVIGAGTVIDAETCRTTILAGSQFVVGPNFDEGVAKCCNSYQIPYIPGCMTPTEMIKAMSFGCEVLKLFPGSAFTPNYIKAIHGPLPHANIMPTGGVSLENVREWIKAGACSVGVGGDLTSAAKDDNYSEVTKRAQAYVVAVKDARKIK